MSDDDRIVAEEATNLSRYLSDAYSAETISVAPSRNPTGYSEIMLVEKLKAVAKHVHGEACVLDLCCGNGAHICEIAPQAGHVVGVDFSPPFVQAARQRIQAGGHANAEAILANARALPFEAASMDVVYSLSALYSIPNVHEVVSEVARVLKPGGYFLGDFGNVLSLNTLVVRSTPGIAHQHCLPLGAMKSMLRERGFFIVSHRSFQLLPMWGGSPAWMRPILSQRVIQFLARRVGGRMLDEWVSSLPLLRRVAFRHFFVCRKVESS